MEPPRLFLERLASRRFPGGVKPARLNACAAAAVAVACLSAGPALAPLAAQEPQPSKTLLPGKGAALTMAKCAICHDITHVTRTRLSRDEWDDNIKVMIARGMPIEPHEIPIVLDYLATYYNRDTPPPAAQPEPAAAGAMPVERVLADNGCMACHAIDKRVVGPAFREVAEKYKTSAGAPAHLVQKIKEGGAGAWGQVPMPPNPQIADDDLTRVVGWVLQQ
jgi:cytochrome c551/c552